MEIMHTHTRTATWITTSKPTPGLWYPNCWDSHKWSSSIRHTRTWFSPSFGLNVARILLSSFWKPVNRTSAKMLRSMLWSMRNSWMPASQERTRDEHVLSPVSSYPSTNRKSNPARKAHWWASVSSGRTPPCAYWCRRPITSASPRSLTNAAKRWCRTRTSVCNHPVLSSRFSLCRSFSVSPVCPRYRPAKVASDNWLIGVSNWFRYLGFHKKFRCYQLFFVVENRHVLFLWRDSYLGFY